jgi:hypothetical protein
MATFMEVMARTIIFSIGHSPCLVSTYDERIVADSTSSHFERLETVATD